METVMPLVILEYQMFPRVPRFLINGLAKELPSIVAAALNVDTVIEAHLQPSDIKVKVEQFIGDAPNTKELEVTVWANHFPERQVNLDERRDAIIEGIKVFFTRGHLGFQIEFTLSVWVLLAPASYGEARIIAPE
ncbi:MAG: hypothetical protein P4M11_01665 [Candidatus Pacebacteria bacterium]|nr:hypothetical protein [Candidatus Paceibacterota bacterium]